MLHVQGARTRLASGGPWPGTRFLSGSPERDTSSENPQEDYAGGIPPMGLKVLVQSSSALYLQKKYAPKMIADTQYMTRTDDQGCNGLHLRVSGMETCTDHVEFGFFPPRQNSAV